MLALMAASQFGPLRDGRDAFTWALSGELLLAPLLFAYSFVLTIVRSDAADWRRRRALFLGLIFYLALALFGLHFTS